MSEGTVTVKRNGLKTRDMVLIALFAALRPRCAGLSAPPPVPTPLPPFGAFGPGGRRGGKRGTLAVLVYILLGAIGLPVFAGFSGGMGSLLGSSGGYIIGFLFSALVMWGMEALFHLPAAGGSEAGKGLVTKRNGVLVLSMVLGLLVCYLFGTVWFMAVYTSANGAVALMTVLGWCVFPFIPFDLLKIALALGVTMTLGKHVPG
ncbi:MAG: biotin transporter BioY [Clostridiales bacterium]|nr:biotin transporter BioY [Clostridiales bacterium]